MLTKLCKAYFSIVLWGLVLFGCGGLEQPVATTAQSDTGPWLCSPSTYNPFNVPWPTHGYCVWQPRPDVGGITPTHVSTCSPGGLYSPGNPPPGSVDLFSGVSLSGKCARVNGAPYPGVTMDWTLVAVNGWNSVIPIKGGVTKTLIQSVAIGPSTGFTVWDAQLTQFHTCNSGHCIGLSNDDPTVSFTVPNWGFEGIPGLEVAAFQVQGP